MDVWTQDWIEGRFGTRTISDRPDPEDDAQPEVARRMAKLADWRSKFTGDYLQQEAPGTKADPVTGEITYRWPSRINFFRSYCMSHASVLFGRGETGREADNLFDLEIDTRVPGIPGPDMTESTANLKGALEYWWSHFQHLLRPAAATQQWSGGAVLKLTYYPAHPASVLGCFLEVIEPEHFWPVWDPTYKDVLLAAKIAFKVSTHIAIEKYGLTPDQAKQIGDGEQVLIQGWWDRMGYKIVCGEGNNTRPARFRNNAGAPAEPMAGPNECYNPNTGQRFLPIWYIPRFRTSGFYGDSLIEDLTGPVEELNKSLSDIGDAINTASHIAGFIADWHAGGIRLAQEPYLDVPMGRIMNLGKTPTGGQQGRFTPLPPPDVPSVTPKYIDTMSELLDRVAMFTGAGRGQSAEGTGFAATMQMLPTLFLADWTRSHWSMAVGGTGGISQCLAYIWINRRKAQLPFIPGGFTPYSIMARQRVRWRPIVPRDKLQKVQEVAQLAANKVLPPRELIKRLGDVENVEEVLGDLYWWLMLQAAWDSAVAGHVVRPGREMKGTEGKQPNMPLPEVAGVQPAKPKQPSTEPNQAKKEVT